MTSIRDIEFMRLFFLSQDVCPTVIRKFVQLKLLSGYNENIVEYLNSDDSKHIFYHRWKRNGQCCLCQPGCCIILKGINNHLFYKLYDVDKGNQVPGHIKQCGARRQFCIHTFTAKNGITLDDLDLYMLVCLLEPCMASLSKQQKTYLEVLKDIRNDICHSNPTDWSKNDINTKWSNLETAILNLDNSNDTKGAIRNLEVNQFTFTESEVDRWLTQNQKIYEYENDKGSDSNLSRLKWFAQFCRTSAREQFKLDLATHVADLSQTATSSIVCRIEVQNETYSKLHTPICTVDEGFISNPPKLLLSYREKSFMLTHNSRLTGTKGVVSWEIQHKDFRVAVMWSIPYSYKSGKKKTH